MSSDTLQLINTVLLALLPISMGILGTWIHNYLVKRGYRTDAFDAMARGAAVGYSYLAVNKLSVTNPQNLAVAVAKGVEYSTNLAQPKLDSAGITDERASAIVGAEMGKLMAADPSISVVKASP